MDAAFLKRVSKHMALLLRHAPERAGLVLDPEGYVHIEDLASALRREITDVDIDTIRSVVEHVEPRKQRYSIVEDYIRANYGHSTADRIDHLPAVPPDVLFHGTSISAMESILAHGLQPMHRQYVHLTLDKQLALSIGSRHGKSCLVKVDARRAHSAGVQFYRANFTFWLALSVPHHFLQAALSEG